MDQLVDMKAKKQVEGLQPMDSEYPYNLRLCLCPADLEKLGVEMLPEMGSEMMLIAKVKVCAVSERDYGDGVQKNLDLQITAMCLKEGKPEKIAYEKKLYEKSE